MSPTIAVVITCYNKAPYVASALQAVLAQVHPADDIVFVDDGSTDDSVAIASEFATANPTLRMRIIRQPNSGQPAHARNAGIATVQAELVVCLDADDSLSPLYLMAVAEAFEREPSIGLAYPSGISFGDGALRPMPREPWDPARLAHTNYVMCVTAFRRTIWEQVGGYRTNVRGYEDWDFWIAASALGVRGAWIPLQLFHYREMVAGGALAGTDGKDLTLRAAIVLNNPTVYDAPTRQLAQAICDDAPVDPLAVWNGTHEIMRAALITAARREAADSLRWAEAHSAGGRMAVELQRLQQLVLTQRIDLTGTRQLGALLIAAGETSQGHSLLLSAWGASRRERLQADGAVMARTADQPAQHVPSRAPRILSWMPYGQWNVHALQEMTILHASRLRGAEVRYVLCDGAFRECDLHWGVTVPRTATSCATCIDGQTQQVQNMKFPHEWLSAHVTPVERSMAAEWAESLPAESLLSAAWNAWTLGAWVVSSVHSHFRANRVDPAQPEHARVMRAYVEGGLLTAFAMQRLIADWRPDVLLQFNGRMASTRVALELARAAGVRVVTHERGWLTETLYLAENADCLSLQPIREAWSRWRDVPLTGAECEQVAQWLTDRAHGRNLNWVAFSTAPGSVEPVRARLRLRDTSPCLVVYTSSEDEYIASKEYGSVFGSQEAWLERTVAWARANPGVDLVVRVHPNTGGKVSTGRNAGQLRWLEAFAARVPQNVRMVWPDDDISSYTLMDLATASLAYVSTVALEAACRGQQSFLAASTFSSGHGFTDAVAHADDYGALLTRYLRGEGEAASRARRITAFRFAYMALYRYMIPFPLVHMPDFSTSRLAYTSLDALQPRQDVHLDRIVDVVLNGDRVCPDPLPAEANGVGAERDWHAAMAMEPAGG